MLTKRKRAVALAVLILITLTLHLFSHIMRVAPGHSNVLKHVLADICYIPIFIGAIWFGIRGAVLSSTVIGIFSLIFVLYFPPQIRSQIRSDFLEIFFFFLVGGVSGIVLNKDRRTRKAMEEKIKAEHQRLYDVLETLPAYVALLAADYQVPFANRTFREKFGESNGKRCYDFLFNRDEPCPDCRAYEVLKTNIAQNWDWIGPDGRNYDIYDYPFKESDGSTMILEMGIDVTERKKAEARLQLQQEELQLQNEGLQAADEERRRQNEEMRVAYEEIKAAEKNVGRINRIYSVLSAINEAIVHITDVNQLYRKSCQIAVKEGELRMAWIGLANRKTGLVEAVASDGVINGYLNTVTIDSGPDLFGRGPTGTAIRENRHVVCEDIETDPFMSPWREEALKRGYRSSAAFPLRLGARVIGAFTLYSSEIGFFNEEEVKLLISLSNDLSFAIEAIDKEKLRNRAEGALRESEFRLERAIKGGNLALWDLDVGTGRTIRSDRWYEMLGYDPNEIDPSLTNADNVVHPDDYPRLMKEISDHIEGKTPFYEIEFRMRAKSGRWLWVLSRAQAVKRGEDGRAQRIIGTHLEITERKNAEFRILANNSLLQLSARASSKIEYLDQASMLIQEWLNCDAVGIRLLDDSENIPYAAYTGFSKEFWQKENQLSIVRHQCLCIRIISRKPDHHERSNLTTNGSFFTNDTEKFVEGLSKDNRARYRGTCIDYGYKSLGVTPIKYRGDIIGAIHYVDKRTDRFPPAMVEFVELVSDLIGESIYKFVVEEELKSNYEALRQASAYNRSLLEASLDPLVTIGPDGKLNDANAATEAITGRSRSELVGTDFSDYFTDPEQARARYLQVFREGFVRDFPLEIRHSDGHVTAVLYNASLYRNEDGKVIGIFAAARDITERMKLEDALWRTNELLESMFSAIDIHMVYLDKDFNFIRVNRAYAETCGYPIDFFPGKNHFALYPNAENEAIFREVVRSGKPYSVIARPFEFPDHRKRGVTYWDWSLHPIFEPDGSVGGLVFSLIDVTLRERASREISQMNAALAAANAELQQFAYIASHDLQEPLRMISSYLQLIEKRYKDKIDSDVNDFIDFAVDGAKRLQKMINSLLAYSRVGTRGLPPKKESAELALEHALANLKVAIEESRATVVADCLPEIYVDINQLIQIFQNLIGNSIKFRSSRPPLVEISAEQLDGYWLFKVKDNGIGIDREYWDKIFNIFHRLHGAEFPGTGIGLALCKRIVERHGGSIWLESVPAKGSIFYFTMPMNPEV